MDLVGPARVDQAIHGSPNKDVPEMKGIQNAGVEDRNARLKRHSAA
jgi:hypothetical protein